MDLFSQLRERRVPQFVSAYVVGGWGVVQFVTFLEGRLMLSPHLVNLCAVGLLTLLPSVVLLAWCHGRPGVDNWGRAEKVSIPVNLLAAFVLLIVLFSDKDLGAVTETVAITDENGTVSERMVPKHEYRRRALVFYLENTGDAGDDWLRRGLATALVVDLNQDPFVDMEYPVTRVAALRRAGHTDGLDVPRPLMREIAREAHCAHFLTGSFARGPAGLTLELEVHATGTGRQEAELTVTAPDVFTLVDEASVLIRREIGVPSGHIDAQEDLPVADVMTADPDALRSFVEGMALAIHDNDWEGAGPELETAVEKDPSFALAHFLLYAVRLTNGYEPGANTAMTAAMANLYRMSERAQFQVKVIYYFNMKEDPDKAQAVLEMWTRLYPNDVAAYQQVAFYAGLRQDHEAVVTAYEKILAIDPAQHQVLVQLADAYQDRGEFEAAESHLRRYADLYPTDERSFTQLADLYVESGRLEQAREALEQAQLIAPDRPQTLRDLADIDTRLGRFAEAEMSLLSLRASADNSEDELATLEDLFKLCTVEGRSRRSLALLDEWTTLALESINPSQVWLIHGVWLRELEATALADSLHGLIRNLRTRIGPPSDQLMGMCEARQLIVAGRLDEAATALAETEAWVDRYKFEVLRPGLLTTSGLLAEMQGDLDGALAIHAQGLELDPTNNTHQRRLGRLQRLTGHDDEAAATLEKALARNPGHPETNLEMALLEYSRGRTDAARIHLEKAQAAWRRADADHPGAAAATTLARQLGTVP